MSFERSGAAIAEALLGSRELQATVLAIVSDLEARALLVNVLGDERLAIASDFTEGLAVAEADPPDLAFIEIGLNDGAGLALVHHIKALVPGVTVVALASVEHVEKGAHAMALGAAGTLILPIGGDEVQSAVSNVKMRLAEKLASAEVERAAQVYARAAGWMARVAEIADAESRTQAAERLVEVLIEATEAHGGAVYVSAGERSSELVRVAASPSLESAPAFGLERDIFEHARQHRLLAVPLAFRKLRAGHVLLSMANDERGPRSRSFTPGGDSRRSQDRVRLDGLVRLLATQAATALTLLTERERAGGSAMKDPTSSAYSFAYYADVAGREIDRARRYSRRFSVATVAFEGEAEKLGAAEMADHLLKAARDTDVLARVDEHEFHLLMPETDGLGAHAYRRRVLGRLGAEWPGATAPPGVLVGVATYPHDGQDLSQLLRVARRRADGTRASVVHRLPSEPGSIAEILDAMSWEVEGNDDDVTAPRAIELPTSEAVALATMVITDALRGGATFVAVAHHPSLSLGAAVRASMGAPRGDVTAHVLDVRPGADASMEALAVLAEHGAYAFVGRNEGGVVRGMHAADPLLAEFLAERLGRAAGLRVLP